jgi:hypothetical protein
VLQCRQAFQYHSNTRLISQTQAYHHSQCMKPTFHFTAVDSDHAGPTVPLLTIDWNLDANLVGNNGQLLAYNGPRHGLAVDSHLVVVVWPIAEAGVVGLAERVVVFKGVAEAFEESKVSGSGKLAWLRHKGGGASREQSERG